MLKEPLVAAFRGYAAQMRKEVSQGLGVLAVAAICAVIALVAGEVAGSVAWLGAVLFALIGLGLLAVGLLRRA